jgi:methylated-DNA-[protein]-cysteine S-methyltransferase
MAEHGFVLFDTSIGLCGVVWGVRGIVGVQLPEGGEQETLARIRGRFPAAREANPPTAAKRAVRDIVALLGGERRDLSAIVLDMTDVPPFHRRVYEIARTIPAGTTLSYGEVAARLGSPGSARAVGQALRRNPFAVVVPCHRVLAAGGKPGGFSATGGVTTKLRMLSIERASGSPRALFDGERQFDFDTRAALGRVRDSDAALARLVDAVGPFRMRLQSTPSVFAALAEAIVYQQLTAKAAGTIFGRVRALFPDSPDGPTPEGILSISDEALRGAGLSRGKLASLRDLAARSDGGEIPTLAEIERMDDEDVIERLTIVRGVGRWTVEMFLMFRLGRPDVLPLDDHGLRKGFAVAFKKSSLPGPRDLEKRGARWKPYRTVASWYLWRAAELGQIRAGV